MRPLLPARSTASSAPTPPGIATVTATSVGTIDAAVPKLCTGTDFPERPLASRKRAGSALAWIFHVIAGYSGVYCMEVPL